MCKISSYRKLHENRMETQHRYRSISSYPMKSLQWVQSLHLRWNHSISASQITLFNQFIQDGITESLQLLQCVQVRWDHWSVQSLHIKWNHSINSHQMEFFDHFISDVIFLSVHIRWNYSIRSLTSFTFHEMNPFNQCNQGTQFNQFRSHEPIQWFHSGQSVYVKWNDSISSDQMKSSN
jgi:hypothetical protein